MNILIVDDSSTCRYLHRVILQVGSNKVHVEDTIDEASDGEEAVEMCKVKQYDVILMDVFMRGMNGVEAAKVIKGNVAYKTKIIFVTGYVEIGALDITVGDALMFKPVDAETLRRKVRT